MKTRLNEEMLNNMSKDLGNWRGPFYFNRKDPRLIVPKMNPTFGQTLNFANPISYLAITALVALVFLVSII